MLTHGGRICERRLILLARSILLGVALSACGGTGIAPQADVSTGQALIELSDAINAMRDDSALLQAQMDSLRGEVARQDSVLRQVAAMAGVPMRAR